MEEWKVNFFAKHLTDRELLKDGYQVNDFRRPAYLAKCLPGGEIEAPVSKLSSEIMNASSESINTPAAAPVAAPTAAPAAAPAKKMGRPKKVVEEVFEGLNQEQK